MDNGTVYWLTGLSGAGKSTLGSLLFKHLREIETNVVYLDGDTLREVFGGKHGHTQEERRQLAMRYSRLCKMLSDQGIDVVCATISLFHEVQDWNRNNILKYKEIYIEVPMSILIERDQKELYSRALRGEINNVMGIDVDIEAPKKPDVIVVNDGTFLPDKTAENLIVQLNIGVVPK